MGRPKSGLKGHLTRTQLSYRWDVDIKTIRRWQELGKLPSIVKDGVHYFPIGVIQLHERGDQFTVRRRIAPEPIDARVFDMLKEGSSLVDVVTKLRVPVEMVEKLYDDFMNPDLAVRKFQRTIQEQENQISLDENDRFKRYRSKLQRNEKRKKAFEGL